MPDLSSGSLWQFNTPPPTAKIINFGQINVAGGGPAFLIASDIENNGTISAPNGKIGLFAGEEVLVSLSPDGRGLNARVTLPQGSVDNEGKLIADAGSIALKAQTVNQGGLIQANSIQNVNGVIELTAGDSLNLEANSVVSAKGDSVGISSGGAVTIKSDNTFSDQAGSAINISGGTQGGNGGHLEISAPQLGLIHSRLNGRAVGGFVGGTVTLDPIDITLDDDYINSLNDLISGGLSQINLQADNNIELSASSIWSLTDLGSPGSVNLTAGNNIIFDDGTGIQAGKNWSVNLTAGTSLSSGVQPTQGNYGIYLNGSASISSLNGDISLSAPNEVIVNGGSITTWGGGNINVTTAYGDVNTGQDVYGYTFGMSAAPYYKVGVDGNLGGISTAAGGNVSISAGGNVISYLPIQSDYINAQYDGGSGAFSPTKPGNVTITAGGNVYGHYVVGDGTGIITAQNGNAGAPQSVLLNYDANANQLSWEGFALSLINGSWQVNTPKGDIYLQDVRNPNGIFGEIQDGTSPNSDSVDNYPGYHYFDYGAQASVSLNAGGSIELIGNNDASTETTTKAPHVPSSQFGGSPIPIIFPPSLQVVAGGDFTLDSSIILFPSPFQNLNISIGGNLIGMPTKDAINLQMSDSGRVPYDPNNNWAVTYNRNANWADLNSYGLQDHASTPLALQNLGATPVNISISGNLESVNLYTTRATQLTVGGNMINSGFVGQNLNASDVTSLNVTGRIYTDPLYAFATLASSPQCVVDGSVQSWDYFFQCAITPDKASSLTTLDARNPGPNGLAYLLKSQGFMLFPAAVANTGLYGQKDPNFLYDPVSGQMSYRGNMSSLLSPTVISALESGSFTVLKLNSGGQPIIDASGKLETTTCTFNQPGVFSQLFTASQANVANKIDQPGYQIGGPGEFDIHAGSIELGYSSGIGSSGFGRSGIGGQGYDYRSLKSLLPVPASGGASVNVTVDGDLNMITSAIDSIDGGNVNVKVGGNLNLSENAFNFSSSDCYGIFTTGHSDVNVTANGDINVGSSRIATFNGGNVTVDSINGNVNAGNGANNALTVFGVIGQGIVGQFGNPFSAATLLTDPAPYGSGILAEVPVTQNQTAGIDKPGNITVSALQGNIIAGQGGISQFALNGSIDAGPKVILNTGSFTQNLLPLTVNGKKYDPGTLTGLYDMNGDFLPTQNLESITIHGKKYAPGTLTGLYDKNGVFQPIGSGALGNATAQYTLNPDPLTVNGKTYAPGTLKGLYDMNGVFQSTLNLDPFTIHGKTYASGTLPGLYDMNGVFQPVGAITLEPVTISGRTYIPGTLTGLYNINGDFQPIGNTLLGQGGAIGGTVSVNAGYVYGLIVSRQDANIHSTVGANVTVLAGGSANFSGGGTISGTVVGIGGISVSDGSSISGANLFSANVSGVAGVQNTLGTSVAASSASQSAANQSGNEAKQQLANNDGGTDDQNKKKGTQSLSRHIKRVTVILPKAS